MEQAFCEIMRISREANPISEADEIGDDGLAYCHVCHERKQTRMLRPECLYGEDCGEMIVPRLCACGRAREALQRDEYEREQALMRLDRLRRASLMDSAMREHTFDTWRVTGDGDLKIKTACERYVNAFEDMLARNQGLLLHGDPGTGKTFAAACIANALLAHGIPVFMTSIAQLMALEDSQDDDLSVIDRLRVARLLVLDDLGIERKTTFGREKVYSAIDARYRSGKPMIVTTNLTIRNMKEPDDPAQAPIYDRVLELCYPIDFNGVLARRKAEAKARQQYMRGFLEDVV